MRGPVLVVGELLADVVATGDGDPSVDTLQLLAQPGGSPANVAVGLARLDSNVEFVGRLSGVGLGPWLRRHLTANAVGVRHCIDAVGLPTLALVGLDPAGVATYGFYGSDTVDWQWRTEELPDVRRSGAAAIHTGSLACALTPGADAIEAWVDQQRGTEQVLVSYDPNVRPGVVADLPSLRERVERWVRRSDLVKVSDEDLEVLYPDLSPLGAARRWAAWGPELLVVTHGAGGTTALRPGAEPLSRSGLVVDVVDTVGAGDAFAAGLLAWLDHDGSLRPGGPRSLTITALGTALDQANQAAAITCTRAGADPPRRHELPPVRGH